MRHFSVPGNRGHVGFSVRVLLAGFGNLGVARIFSNIEEQHFSPSKGQEVVLQVVPLGTHNGELVFFSFLFVDDALLGFETFGSGRGRGIGVDDVLWVPKEKGAIFHTGEDKAVGVGAWIESRVLSF